MQLLVATLCDSASENQGKLNIVGAFDTIVSPKFPAGFSCNLAIRFCFAPEDRGRHPFSVRLVEDGKPSPEPTEETLMEVKLAEGVTFCTQNMITPLQGNIKEPGMYYFEVHFGENVLARIPFQVIDQSRLATAPAA